jgi:hypothetical protein
MTGIGTPNIQSRIPRPTGHLPVEALRMHYRLLRRLERAKCRCRIIGFAAAVRCRGISSRPVSRILHSPPTRIPRDPTRRTPCFWIACAERPARGRPLPRAFHRIVNTTDRERQSSWETLFARSARSASAVPSLAVIFAEASGGPVRGFVRSVPRCAIVDTQRVGRKRTRSTQP